MKTRRLTLIGATLLGLAGTLPSPAKELSELNVLYVGSERAAEYVAFLKPNVARVEARSRAGFQPAEAASFDVVLLDWPQSDETREMRKLTSPLGARERWNKPTVLLGSAGLNLAVAWKMKGGSGCTCMEPLACGLREHQIFEHPFKIDRTKMIHIPTPADFQSEISAKEIEVLPLVHDWTRNWYPGWCSYASDFARYPEVEYFCGGVNEKTPTAAGLWRQGNLLHFGFQQSPAEMNETGQRLLLNSIAYISRFTEDRPIAVTPSVFAGPVARSRSSVKAALRNKDYRLDWVLKDLSPALAAELTPLSRDQMVEWADQRAPFLHPNSNQQLEIDEDLVALGVPFDDLEFFPKAIAGLRSDDAVAVSRSQRLLARYVPIGPLGDAAETWAVWWKENQPYAFASDSGDYRWYIDPLARARNVPSRELRGPLRADPVSPQPITASRAPQP